MTTQTVYRRVNITLPKDTLKLIDRITEKKNRSRFLNEAVRYYVREAGRANLRKFLREGAAKRAERDLSLVQEWFTLEHEAWQKRRSK